MGYLKDSVHTDNPRNIFEPEHPITEKGKPSPSHLPNISTLSTTSPVAFKSIFGTEMDSWSIDRPSAKLKSYKLWSWYLVHLCHTNCSTNSWSFIQFWIKINVLWSFFWFFLPHPVHQFVHFTLGAKQMSVHDVMWTQKPYLYSAPQPLTKLMRMVHMRVSWYTASKPSLTDCASRAANSWLLKILRLQPGGKAVCKENSSIPSLSLSLSLSTLQDNTKYNRVRRKDIATRALKMVSKS